MLLALLLACGTSADAPADDTGVSGADTADTAGSGADTADSMDSGGDSGDSEDSASDTGTLVTPAFAAAGTFRGAAFALTCAETTEGEYSRSDGVTVLSARCMDAAQPGSPFVQVTISNDRAGVYVTCAYTAGGGNVQVGTADPMDADLCTTTGSSAFRVQAATVDKVGDQLVFVGDFHYADPTGATDVTGSFATNATCMNGC